ncbi:MAG: YoaK family protein [Terricaulis sp.]
MIRHSVRDWILAACLSAIAGFVDAIAFVQLGGFFVSFMSGNSTRLSVGLVSAPEQALIAGGLIASFVLGVIVGTLASRASSAAHAPERVMGVVAILLACAALLAHAQMNAAAIALLAIAMGAENAVFQRDGEVSIGVTYMTGTLVKLGQRLASALTGGPRFDWAPYLILWCGLVVGAICGAIAHAHLALASIWIAAVAALALALVMRRNARAP